MSPVPAVRVRDANESPLRPEGEYVLYWMTAARRTSWNFALDQAIGWARQFAKPLVIFEPLRCGYRWASPRFHQFVIEGMADNARSLAGKPVTYFPYLEPAPHAAEGLLESLAARACLVVTDDFPCFFLPAMVRLAARRLPVRLQTVDGNGVYPMHATDRVFSMAHSFRLHLQKEIRPHLDEFPEADPWPRARLPRLERLPNDVASRWPAADVERLSSRRGELASFPIDRSVGVVETVGGANAARRALDEFLARRLAVYGEERNEPSREATSGLSPYLHFGHISAHEVFSRAMQCESWTPARLTVRPHGKAKGWWQASASLESFLEELLVWREIGYNFCSKRRDYDRYSSLPDWVQESLAKHASDPRPHVYTLDEFERAATHDRLWNAAQNQLVREGRMHNYLRMLWGKKILEWSSSPEEALAVMIELNNKYALDGRNPNSYTGIFWVLGRYDRPWGPERPIFGLIRYMSSDNTAKKLDVKQYVQRYT
ncbi:MAG: deoxyribodipyrimidine photolyase [Pirellulales bacterium]